MAGCFATFTISSALCGAAWSADSLVGCRVLQGMSGGLLAPMTQMMIARAAGKHMARAMGYAALPILLGPILGPVLAGTILQFASWRWLFLVNVPVCLAGIVMAALFLPDDSGERRVRAFDGVGVALLSPGLVLFLYGSDHLKETTGRVLLGMAALLLSFFVRHGMAKGEGALLDLELFQRKVFATAARTQFLSNGVSYAAQMLVPFYLIQVCRKSPSETGLMLAPLGLGRRLASLGLRMGRPPLLWLRRGLPLLVDPVGLPPLRLGLRRKTACARRRKRGASPPFSLIAPRRPRSSR